MDIKEFFSSDNKKHWIDKMKDCDWGAGQWLADQATLQAEPHDLAVVRLRAVAHNVKR